MVDLLRCVAEAVAEKGVRGLADIVPGGGYVFDVAQRAWEKYRKRKDDAGRRAEIQELAAANFDEAKQAAIQAAMEVAMAEPVESRTILEQYLAGIPATVRQTLRRASDPSGTTVPAGFALSSPADLLKLLPQSPPKFRPGDPLPNKPGWVLADLLGTGGFGEVWLARQSQLSSVCGAVKFCRRQAARDLRHESGLIDRVMAAGRHSGVVPLLDVHLEGETPWIMYEYVPGGDLADWILSLQRSPVEHRVKQAWMALRQLADTIGHFHRLNPSVVHRDLKPSNILLDRAGKKLRVTDFGIGGITSRVALSADGQESTSRGRLLTDLRGSHTPLYASPQQRAGADPDPCDDVHALGVIGYQLFTGRLDQGAGPDFADDLREAGISEGLIALLGRCVAHRVERRPADARTLAEELKKLPIPEVATPAPVLSLPQVGPPAVPSALNQPDVSEAKNTLAGPELDRDVEAFLTQIERQPGRPKREEYAKVLDDLIAWSRFRADQLEFRSNPPGTKRQATVTFRVRGGPIFWQVYPRPSRQDAKFCCLPDSDRRIPVGMRESVVERFARLSASGQPDSPKSPTLSFDDLVSETNREQLKGFLGELLATFTKPI